MDKVIGMEPRTPRFAALLPFFVFLVFYLGLSIWAKDFYRVPMPAAFIVAAASAMLLDHKRSLSSKVEIFAQGMGDSNIMIMCLIFILAGAFAAVAKAAGAVDAAVLIARHWIPDNLLLAGFFLVSCFISLAIGTSCGTIAALTPIAAGLVTSMNISPALMIGSVVGGAMFGDNMSMISDTTIAATRTQNVAMKDKFLMNFKIVLPAAVAAVILYSFAGSGENSVNNGTAELADLSWKSFLNVLPYLAILLGALAGLNVMGLLFAGAVMALIIGMGTNSMAFFDALAVIGQGTLGMAETLIVAILAGGLLGVIRYNGGIDYLLNRIEKAIKGPRGCEFGIGCLVSLVNLFTANNTVAIVVAGPVARALSEKFHCDPRRVASILDTASCAVQGLIPYGAQVLIAIGIAQGAGLRISSLELVTSLYYPIFLALALVVSIILPRRKAE